MQTTFRDDLAEILHRFRPVAVPLTAIALVTLCVELIATMGEESGAIVPTLAAVLLGLLIHAYGNAVLLLYARGYLLGYPLFLGEALHAAFRVWPVFFFAQLLGAAAFLLGALACVLPGIYVAARLSLIPAVAVFEDLRPADCVALSWRLGERLVWRLLGLFLAFMALGALVSLPMFLFEGALGLAVQLAIALPSALLQAAFHFALYWYYEHATLWQERFTLPPELPTKEA